MNSDIPLIFPQWDAPANVLAYCTTRDGGFSEGSFAGLNTGNHVGDNQDHVRRNRQCLPASQKIHWLNQVHGFQVLELPSSERDADATISRSTEHFCAVMTADCVPVLLCDTAGKEVAAIHAGWKGLHLQIIGHTVAEMKSDTSTIMAWIGPAISQSCYEVPESLASNFVQYPGVVSRAESADKYLLNLPLIARLQLEALGIQNIIDSQICTYQDERFYSHRAATHNGQHQTGRMVSVIGLTT